MLSADTICNIIDYSRCDRMLRLHPETPHVQTANMESYINSNIGRLFALWSGLLRGLSSLSRNKNGDAEVGIRTIKRIEEELDRFDNAELLPRDYVTAYFISTVSKDKAARIAFAQRLRQARETLEKVAEAGAPLKEREEAMGFLTSTVEDLKQLSRQHHLKFSSIMFGMRKNGYS
jgi:hypothetical protein